MQARDQGPACRAAAVRHSRQGNGRAMARLGPLLPSTVTPAHYHTVQQTQEGPAGVGGGSFTGTQVLSPSGGLVERPGGSQLRTEGGDPDGVTAPAHA